MATNGAPDNWDDEEMDVEEIGSDLESDAAERFNNLETVDTALEIQNVETVDTTDLPVSQPAAQHGEGGENREGVGGGEGGEDQADRLPQHLGV